MIRGTIVSSPPRSAGSAITDTNAGRFRAAAIVAIAWLAAPVAGAEVRYCPVVGGSAPHDVAAAPDDGPL